MIKTLSLHGVLALGACFFPLMSGLSFERALLAGIFVGLHSALRTYRLSKQQPEPTPSFALRLVLQNLALITPWLGFGLGYELLVQPCDASSGFDFFVILPLTNALTGTALGLMASLIGDWGRIVMPLAYGAAFAAGLYRLYTEPAVWLYVYLLGFWPGPIYDEALSALPDYWAFAGLQVSIALGLGVGIVSVWAEGRSKAGFVFVSLLFVGLSVGLHHRFQELGYGFLLDRSQIEKKLLRTIETEHFRVFADPGFDDRAFEAFVSELEFTHHALVSKMDIAPSDKVSVYTYRNAQQKGRLMGAYNTQVAKPWLAEIHIQGMQVPHPVLQHELAHIYLGKLAPTWLRVPLSAGLIPKMGVIEGFAVALEDRGGELDLHEWAAAMRKLKRLPPIGKIIGPIGFYGYSSSVAYTAAGSFLRTLLEQYGPAAVGRIYGGDSFKAAFGQSLQSLEQAWHVKLDDIPLSEMQLAVAAHRFERPSIWNKVCPRAMANLEKQADLFLRAGNYPEAKRRYEQVVALQPARIYPLIKLARSAMKRSWLEEAESLLSRARSEARATQVSRARATEALADVRWLQGNNDEAQRLWDQLLTLHLSTPSARAQWAKKSSLAESALTEPVLRDYLLGFLSGERATAKLIAAYRREPSPLLGYLLGRRLLSLHPEAVPEALETRSQLPQLLREAASITLGRAWGLTGEADAALAELTSTATSATSALHRNQARQWARRIGNGRSTEEVRSR